MFPYLHCRIRVQDTTITALEAPPNDHVIFILNPTSTNLKLPHVKPVKASASRALSLHLSLDVALAESVSFKRGELAVS